jgi:hypothetical protein
MEVIIYVQESIFAMIIQMLSVSFSFSGQTSRNCEVSKFSSRIKGPDGPLKLRDYKFIIKAFNIRKTMRLL